MLQNQPHTGPATIAYATNPGAFGAFDVIDHDSVERSSLEARIRTGFGNHFGACISGFMPKFAYYEHHSGAGGVIGIRNAAEERLFLEDYLEDSIEGVVTTAAGTTVERCQIVEVGQFVVDDRDIVGAFFQDLVPFLIEQGYDWICFTGTGRVRSLLRRVGFHGKSVAIADPASIDNASDAWGSYYEHDPVVVVGKLSDPEGHWITDCVEAV